MNSIYIVLCLLIISVTILSALYMILKFENGYPLNKNDFNELYKNIEEKIIALLEDKE